MERPEKAVAYCNWCQAWVAHVELHCVAHMEDDHTLAEIGEVLGVTRERIRQIQEAGLRKIRNSHHARRYAARVRKLSETYASYRDACREHHDGVFGTAISPKREPQGSWFFRWNGQGSLSHARGKNY